MIGMSRKLVARRWLTLLVLVGLVAVAVVGTSVALGSSSTPGSRLAAINFTTLRIGSTTSVRDSGLMDKVALPAFAALHPEITVQPLYVGSGAAMTNAKAGAYDVVIAHWAAGERDFMAQGYGALRMPIMYNYFKTVGPKADPAHVMTATSASEAFRRIATWGRSLKSTSRVAFVSRGDVSGTYEAELALWKAAGITLNLTDPNTKPYDGNWYITTGRGMGPTLTVTNQKMAYTLTDTSTWIEMKPTTSKQLGLPDIVGLLVRSAWLKNQYDLILLNQAKLPDTNSSAAELLAQYLVSYQGQSAIAGYKQFGQRMFFSDAFNISNYRPYPTPAGP
jgi:tungstate transport system substrate-binding protein